MVIRKADVNDIPELVRLRVEFLNEVNSRTEPPQGYEDSLEQYFRTSMADGTIVSWLAVEDGAIVATGGVCFYHITPGYSNPSGGMAYILNMYTVPQYRGRGLAPELFGRLIEEAKARGYKKFSLHATAAGRKVYEKFGFKGTEDEMVLRV